MEFRKIHGKDYQVVWVGNAVKNIGFKFNFTDLQAAIGLEQLKKLPKL